MGYVFLAFLAVALVIAMPTEPLAWAFAVLIALGIAALIYNKTRQIQSEEAMIQLNERDKRR